MWDTFQNDYFRDFRGFNSSSKRLFYGELFFFLKTAQADRRSFNFHYCLSISRSWSAAIKLRDENRKWPEIHYRRRWWATQLNLLVLVCEPILSRERVGSYFERWSDFSLKLSTHMFTDHNFIEAELYIYTWGNSNNKNWGNGIQKSPSFWIRLSTSRLITYRVCASWSKQWHHIKEE